MRPLYLKFAGIGSYPGKVEIDFNDLSAMGLYLIVGRTGAGKTTIFDAMTYALYGKVAADRENAIVSGHTNREAPFIEFTFEHAGITYIAHREPAIPGKPIATNKQWLSILDSTGNETSRISQTRQVNEKVKDVIGLNEAEFMQVILLPQGKFQQFLLAKSNDKKGMLQAIFGTSAYKRIVDRMMVSAKQLQTELDKESEEINNQWAIIKNAHDTLVSHEIFDDIPDFVEETDALIAKIEELAAESDIAAKNASEHFATTKTALAQAEIEADRFDKSVQLAAIQGEHAKNEKLVAKARASVSKHESAAPIADAISIRDALQTEVKDLNAAIKELRTTTSRLTSSIKIASTPLKKFSDAIATATPSTLTSEFSKAETFITQAREKYEELTEVVNEIVELEKTVEQLEKLQSTKKVELEKAVTQIAETKTSIATSRAATKDLKTVEREVEKLDDLLEEADESDAKAAITEATKLRDKQQKKFDDLSASLKAEQDKRTRQLAGELASELNNGDECPVCGSVEHPKKAKKTAGTVDIESLASKRDNQLELIRDAEHDLKEAQKALKKAQDAKAKLPSVADQKNLRKKYDSLTKLSDDEDRLAERLVKLEEVEKTLRKEMTDAKLNQTEVSANLVSLKKRRTSLSKETESIGTVTQVDAAIAALDEIADSLHDLDEAASRFDEKQGQQTQAIENLSKLLAKTDFAGEKAVLAAILADDLIDEFEKVIADADERTVTIGKLKAVIGDKPLPQKRPNTEDLLDQVALATKRNEDAQKLNGVLNGALKDISKASTAIKKKGPTFAEKQHQVQRAYTMATIFKDGTTTASGKQLDLETWVLRTLFEEVCLVANDQMRQLSSNRYTLTLDQEEGGVAKRRGGGLDIYVLDAQTGLTRPVQTMSGGEQFIASLALALALAEVVQRHAGGIEVPCLFIDEGFGGLDLETLDLAIDVLLGIQATGRSVGVITHVETMQQLLPIGIQIHKGHSGSTLEVLAS